MAEKLPNPFESKKGTEDYIGFSASSTPREDKFQPRRGKQNRQDNWRRFGAFEQQRQQRGGGGGGMLPVQGGYSPQTSSNLKINIYFLLHTFDLEIDKKK